MKKSSYHIALILCSSLVLSFQAMAQDLMFPALYSVTNVATNDVLNVREGASSSHPIVSSFQPATQNIEVIELSKDGKWGLVAISEEHGWASMNYLARQAGQAGTDLPRPLTCFGAEPSWFLKLETDQAQFSEYGDNPMTLNPIWEDTAVGMGPYIYGMLLKGSNTSVHASIERTICSDGMSDTLYGLSINAFYSNSKGTHLYTGCCTMR